MLYFPSIRINTFKPQMEDSVMDAAQICQAVFSPNPIEEDCWRIPECSHGKTMRH